MFDANKLLNQMLGSGPSPGGRASGKSPMDEIGGLFGSLLSDSVSGVKEGAAAIEQKTGIGATADKAVRDATGKSTGQLFDKVKEFADQNRVATTAALGGLGALLLGSKGGRGVLGAGATLGGLAMIGGLAYKAFQNLQAKAKPGVQNLVEAAPAESPYGETGDPLQDNDAALLILRSMIAAAACDGTIDSTERARIIDGLEDAGLEGEAARFLDHEFARPSSIADLAAGAKNEALAAEVYTAARIAIDPNSRQETMFLTDLAKALKLEPGMVAQIDAGTTGVRFH